MKFIGLLKKYKVYILGTLLVIFFFRACNKSTQVRRNDEVVAEKVVVIDSLQNVIKSQKDTIDMFPSVLRHEKINIHLEYDNYISVKDRGEQLMELHMIIKENLKELRDVK